MRHPADPHEGRCRWQDCPRPATHKVAEDARLYMHEMSTYLCCLHMAAIGMDCSTYPYEAAMTDPFPDGLPRRYRCTECQSTWPTLTAAARCHLGIGGVVEVGP